MEEAMREETSNPCNVIPPGHYNVVVYDNGAQEWLMPDKAQYAYYAPQPYYIMYNTGDLVKFTSTGIVMEVHTHDGLHYKYQKDIQ